MADKPQELTFSSGKEGSNLVVLGQIHGNEPCGMQAINRVAKELQDGTLVLRQGSLRMIYNCNPRAVAENKRYIDKNLNRIFTKHLEPQCYEEHLANTLIKLIGKPDFILDLHSFHTGGRRASAFAMRFDSGKLVGEVAKRLPIDCCLNEWQEIQQAAGRPKSFSTADHAKSIGVPAIGVECGQHDSPLAKRVAYYCIREVLAKLGICDFKNKKKIKAPQNLFFKYLHVYQEPGEFFKAWKGFENVKKGEPIAKLASGEIIRAAVSGKIIFPFPQATPGEEWFYIARESKRSKTT